MIEFFKNLFGFGFKSKVMKVVNKRINDVAKAHDNEQAELSADKVAERHTILHEADVKLEDLNLSHKLTSAKITEKHVNSILGSFN